MKEWMLVSVETPLMLEPLKVVKLSAMPLEDWRVRPNHLPSLYGDEPATEKQLALINNAGLTDTAGLTKYDASRWIDLILDADEARESLDKRQLQAMKERQIRNEKNGLGCDGHRTPSGQYRREIKYCLQFIQKERETTRKAIEAEPESKHSYLRALKDEEKSCAQDIDQQTKNRVEYWICVIKCSKAKQDKRFEIMADSGNWDTYMYVEDALAEKLFSIASRLPRVPTKKEVKTLLAKIDAVSDNWDDEQPDLLLLTLLKEIAA